ncbi:T9SS type A sorting domain-containing protein [Owenweeksia hongkongensis]|uniref:T9SS type A sorting domain-containing protein n=1 Tax=Owenweeksia hongkongensis TaxID=253245 RepID=UPI003A940489
MKKVLLALSLMGGIAGYSQSNDMPSDLKLDAKEVAHIENLIAKKKLQSNKKKTAGGVITNQFMGFVDEMYTLFGGSAQFSIFQNPMWQDSTAVEVFSNADQHISNHAIGLTFDPTSPAWGANQVAEVDDYTIDSVYILGAYRTPSSIPNPMGDSLIVELVWAPSTSTTTFNEGTVTYTNGSPDESCDYVAPTFTLGTPPSFSLEGSNKVRIGLELTANDTTNTSAYYGLEVNQLIPAGNIVGVSYFFKSAYASGLSVGDTVFNTVTPSTVSAPNFAGRLAQDPAIALSNLNMYFCDAGNFGGMNGTSSFRSAELYNLSNGFPCYFPESFNGNFVAVMMSANSTIGLDEVKEEASFNVFPNPTTGNVTLEIAQGGTYTIDVLNLVGQAVYSEQVSINGGEALNRNFSNLTKGVYLINLSGEGISKTTKLTIK